MNALWAEPDKTPSTCQTLFNPLFVQYTCVMNEGQQRAKYFGLCVISFCGLMTCFLFTILTRWLHYKGRLNQVEWDMATVTAADYSVEVDIKKRPY